MKKIFSLAIALIAFVGFASAQDVEFQYFMEVEDNDGNVTEYAVDDVDKVTFGYEDWEEYATADFAFHIYWYDYDTYGEVYKKNLTVYRSTFNPNRYKVAKWAYDSDADVDFIFYWDQEDDSVTAGISDTGEEYSYWFFNYGEIYADEVAHWNGGSWTYNSYKENDVFYFSLIYYCDGGYFGYTGDSYGDSYETLTITSYK